MRWAMVMVLVLVGCASTGRTRADCATLVVENQQFEDAVVRTTNPDRRVGRAAGHATTEMRVCGRADAEVYISAMANSYDGRLRADDAQRFEPGERYYLLISAVISQSYLRMVGQR